MSRCSAGLLHKQGPGSLMLTSGQMHFGLTALVTLNAGRRSCASLRAGGGAGRGGSLWLKRAGASPGRAPARGAREEGYYLCWC